MNQRTSSYYVITVRRPNGAVLDSRSGQLNQVSEVTLPEDGRYTVEMLNDCWQPAPAGTFLTVTGLPPVDAGAWKQSTSFAPALGPLQTARWTLDGPRLN